MSDDIVGVDKDRKVAITGTGREIPIPKDVLERFLKKAGRSSSYTRTKEGIKKEVLSLAGEKKGVLGQIGALAGQFGEWSGIGGLLEQAGDLAITSGAALSTRQGQERMSFLEKAGENFQATRDAKREARSELAEEFPKSAIAGGALGVGADIGLANLMPSKGYLAAPIYGAGVSRTNPIEEPGKWLGGRAIDAGAGYAIDKVTGALVNAAGQRAAKRDYPALRKQAEETKRVAQEVFDESTKETKAAIRNLTVEQQQARRAYGNNVRVQTGMLGTEMSVDLIPRVSLKTNEFVNNSINASAMAGTPEGKKLTNFLTSLVDSRPENMGWKDLGKVINAVEDRIIVATEEELPHLLAYKEHLLKVVPKAVGEASSKRKYATRIMKSALNDVDSGVTNLMKNKEFSNYIKDTYGKNGEKLFRQGLAKDIKISFNGMSNEEFSYLVNSGEIGNHIENVIQRSEAMQALKNAPSSGLTPSQSKFIQKRYSPQTIQQVQDSLSTESSLLRDTESFVDNLAEKISASTERFANDVAIESKYVSDKVSGRLRNIQGTAEALPQPVAPTLTPTPPIPEPEVMGFLANLAEKPMSSFVPKIGGRQSVGGVTAMGGAALLGSGVAKAPIIAGTAAVGAAAGAGAKGALNLATSPGKIGDITRKGISYFGKMLPTYLESKYESYEDGVLMSPEDRLAACIEIENDPYLSNQDKAIIQTKINKGQRIR